MSLHQNILACLLLTASVCQAQMHGQRVTTSSDRAIQPWLVGLAAMVGFLFIVFVLLIVKRLLKKEKREEHGWHDNKAMTAELGEEVPETKQTNL